MCVVVGVEVVAVAPSPKFQRNVVIAAPSASLDFEPLKSAAWPWVGLFGATVNRATGTEVAGDDDDLLTGGGAGVSVCVDDSQSRRECPLLGEHVGVVGVVVVCGVPSPKFHR